MISDPAMVRALNASASANRPQNITPRAPVGSLLKRPAEPAPRLRKADTERDPEYLAMVRQCPCLKCGMEPTYEAAHVRMASAAFGKASGLQKKPADKWALPLCPDDHRLVRTCQHNQGEALFWDKLGINALLVCERLHAVRGDLVAMRAVILTAVAERGTK